MSKKKPDPVDVLDAMYQDAAIAAADDGRITAEDRKWADGVRARIHEQTARLRRNLLPAEVKIAKAPPIRPKYLAMARAALEATLARIVERHGPDLQVSCRNLTELSDDDLRRLLETIDADPDEVPDETE